MTLRLRSPHSVAHVAQTGPASAWGRLKPRLAFSPHPVSRNALTLRFTPQVFFSVVGGKCHLARSSLPRRESIDLPITLHRTDAANGRDVPDMIRYLFE